MKRLTLPSGSSPRGAQMGRPNVIPKIHLLAHPLLQMERLRLDSGGYDKWGAYFGFPDNLYCAWGHSYHALDEAEPIFVFVRAKTRSEAKTWVRDIIPTARFFR